MIIIDPSQVEVESVWSIVEDLIEVSCIIMMPAMAHNFQEDGLAVHEYCSYTLLQRQSTRIIPIFEIRYLMPMSHALQQEI